MVFDDFHYSSVNSSTKRLDKGKITQSSVNSISDDPTAYGCSPDRYTAKPHASKQKPTLIAEVNDEITPGCSVESF